MDSTNEFSVLGRLAAEPAHRTLDSGAVVTRLLLTVQSGTRLDVLPVTVWNLSDEVRVEMVRFPIGGWVEATGSIQRRFAVEGGRPSSIELVADPSMLRFYGETWHSVPVATDELATTDDWKPRTEALVKFLADVKDMNRATSGPRHLRSVGLLERPPSVGPTEKSFLFEVVIANDSTSPTPTAQDVCNAMLEALPKEWYDMDIDDWQLVNINPWAVVELEATEPAQLIDRPGPVFVRMSAEGKGHGFPNVELAGPIPLVAELIETQWSEDQLNLVIDSGELPERFRIS